MQDHDEHEYFSSSREVTAKTPLLRKDKTMTLTIIVLFFYYECLDKSCECKLCI